MNQPSHRDRLWAVRGAVQAARNDEQSILDCTEELMRELLGRNSVDADHIVSVIFTCTDDLDAEFPAVAARRLGLNSVPLLCAREMHVPDALPRVIRLLLHCYGDPDTPTRHVYLRDAVSLRRDLEHAQ